MNPGKIDKDANEILKNAIIQQQVQEEQQIQPQQQQSQQDHQQKPIEANEQKDGKSLSIQT